MLAAGDCGDGSGILEIQPDGYGFLRAKNLLPGRDDVYVSGTQIRRFRLRNGDLVAGKTRSQRENDRYAAMLYITSINGEDAEEAVKLGGDLSETQPRADFDSLTPSYPDRQIRLSSRDENDMVLRLIDLFAPIGFGQRAMIVAAPKTGKTTILKKIALSLKRNHPDVHTMMLLVDERPEEVTDLKESVGGDIFYSTFDEPAESQARVSELTLARAMRLVEEKRDVVILLDSLTRMSRAYNNLMPSSARVMSGGLAAGALNKPKRFFGAARNIREGGSLTIIATALVDTGSRMDGVIFEEFKGTGNMELTLDRQLSERRLFPAVSLTRSGTRHDELILSEKELEVAAQVRNMAPASSEQETISLLLSMLEKSRDNEEFVARFDDWMKLMRGGSQGR
jgi:transcription termination factor Rho